MGLNLGGGFAQGMAQGQSIFKTFNDQFERAQEKRDLAAIAGAKSEESTGYTADQGKELEGLAAKGYKLDFDQGQNAYIAKNDAGDTKTIAMSGVTDFLGNRTAGSLTPEHRDSARMNAMAEVMGKRDPLRGLQLRSEARREQRSAVRDGREDKQWAQEDAIASIDNGLGQEFQKSLTGPDGKPRAATADDYLAQSQKRITSLVAGGHAKAAGDELQKNLALMHAKIQIDGKQREEAFGKASYAAANGDYTPMQDAYNKYVPDGMKVTGVDVGKDGVITMNRTRADGSAADPRKFKNQDELLATMNTLNNPMALYQYAGSEQQRALQLKQDGRADEQLKISKSADQRAWAADGRAASSHSAAMGDRQEVRSVREALAREADPNLTPTQLRAIRAGILQTPGADKSNAKYEFDPVRLHKMFGDTSVDALTGKETVKRNAAEEKKFMEFMGDNAGIRDLDEGLVKYNRTKTQAAKKERSQQPPRVSGAAEFAKLPSGSRFTDPNGSVRIKP